jgi:micrococcal nuclease
MKMFTRYLATALILFSATIACATLKGKVVGVSDGDTFTLLTADNKQYKIRIYGIDCPEKKQDFGQVAKKFTSDKIFNQFVEVEEKDIDRWGRTVGIVLVGKMNLNEELLKAGLAWHFWRYDNNPAWKKLELDAKARHVGIWSSKNPIAPWDFRKQKSSKPIIQH